MNILKLLAYLYLLLQCLSIEARESRSGCENGHWVQSVSSDGSIVILEDSSVWQVNLIDRVDTMLWLPITDITVCGDALVNTEDNEVAEAIRIR